MKPLTSDPSLSGALCEVHQSSAAASSSSAQVVNGCSPPETEPLKKIMKNTRDCIRQKEKLVIISASELVGGRRQTI